MMVFHPFIFSACFTCAGVRVEDFLSFRLPLVFSAGLLLVIHRTNSSLSSCEWSESMGYIYIQKQMSGGERSKMSTLSPC